MRRTALLLAATCLLTPPVSPRLVRAEGSLQYQFSGLRGKAVAAEDGRPLAGAIVLVLWGSHAPAPYQFKLVHVVETDTGPDGTFIIPPWSTSLSNPLNDHSPSILVFAPHRVAYSATLDKSAASSVRTFPIALFDGQPDHRASQLRKLAAELALVWVTSHGRPYPRILASLDTDWHPVSSKDQGHGSPSQMFDVTVQAMRYGYEQELLRQR